MIDETEKISFNYRSSAVLCSPGFKKGVIHLVRTYAKFSEN